MVESAKKLPPLSQYQQKLAVKQCLSHIAKLDSKSKYWCLECGHSWKAGKNADLKNVICPHCKTKLKVEQDRKRKHVEKVYFAIVTTCKGFQVVRTFILSARYKKGEALRYWFGEPFQRWIDENGREAIYGLARHWMGVYVDRWDWGSDMEIRSENYAHSVAPYAIIGQIKAIPKLIRNGYHGKGVREIYPVKLIHKLLTDSRYETLIKARQYALVEHLLKSEYRFCQYWGTAKVAIRHNYIIPDGSLWCDMLDFMIELGKDIHNPQLICPINLKEAHDEWEHKVRTKRHKDEQERMRLRQLNEEQRYLENKKKAGEEEEAYQKLKSRFFDIAITDKDMVIKPLVSVMEFLEEGHQMHHCVFSNGYYKREDCLILHAMIDNVSVATIELNLNNLSIVQCRGKHNCKPEQYDRIVTLINTNIGTIAARRAA